MKQRVTSEIFRLSCPTGTSTEGDYPLPKGSILNSIHITSEDQGIIHVNTSLFTEEIVGAGTKVNIEIPDCTGWNIVPSSAFGSGGARELTWIGALPIPTDYPCVIKMNVRNDYGSTLTVRICYTYQEGIR